MKKLISVLCMAGFATVFTAKADALEVAIDGVYYSLNKDLKTAVVTMPFGETGVYQIPLSEDGALEIPSSLTYQGEAFVVVGVRSLDFQNGLRHLVLPESVEEVSTINGCPLLGKLEMKGVKRFTPSSINDLPSLTEIFLCDHADIEIASQCFNRLGVEELVFPQGIHELEGRNFENCDNLLCLDMSALSKLNSGIGNNCQNLELLRLPTWLESEETTSSFNSLPKLQTIELPAEVGDDFRFCGCFEELPSLETIYAPSAKPIDVMRVSDWGDTPIPYVAGNDGESNIKLEYTNVGQEQIDTEGCVVYVPLGSVGAYRAHPSWSVFKNIVEYDFASGKAVASDGIADVTPAVIVDNGAITVAGGDPFEVYDMAGRRTASLGLSSGLYIVKTLSGRVAKVRVH